MDPDFRAFWSRPGCGMSGHGPLVVAVVQRDQRAAKLSHPIRQVEIGTNNRVVCFPCILLVTVSSWLAVRELNNVAI